MNTSTSPEPHKFYWVRLNSSKPWTIGFVGDNFNDGTYYFNVPVLGYFPIHSLEWHPEPLLCPNEMDGNKKQVGV